MLAAPRAWAYRPFVSTDAAVADPKEFEIELGVLTVDRTGHENTYTTPSVVLNYGILDRWELVAEFRVQEGSTTEVTDPGVSLKTVLKEGVLQGKGGLSLAVEIGLLLPSTLNGEGGVGFEGTGIISGRFGPVMLHANAGGGVDRSDARPFVTWGLIGELPVTEKVRLVSEVNGESARGRRSDNAVLLGVIWKPSSSNIFVDAAVRRGISGGAPDWEFTAGVTFGFKPASPPRQGPGSL
ncbi:MAG TPA: hypothetical protein VJX92_07425 [Methylomirabilota bacterium]|nr:hypothetical protein [Methylomirabilota bacterium]